MSLHVDQLGDTIDLPGCPERIISVVPSITELLYYLGLEKQVVAVTKFCVRPLHLKDKLKIGGTKNLHVRNITELVPDLIIANKEENTREDVQALKECCPVWVSDVNTLENALDMIEAVGVLTCTSNTAQILEEKIRREFLALQKHSSLNYPPVSTAYLIWRNPLMTVGADTFISDMMRYCNLRNAFSAQTRYPVIDVDALRHSDCRLILVSSEPYPFKEEHIKELQDALPGKVLIFVDGEMFSWYGSRLIHASLYFRNLVQVISEAHLTALRV